eukprot:TRINITY_DN5000_c0_g1_i1.p1 TRINITY_DN5000_c0_g1~~TRINITY_DN5000_c0_g1_i1.p1  ORF type:complete len:257 (-),score=33.90 TRINITY_DN5000_c0_g1_i1:63-833(-)
MSTAYSLHSKQQNTELEEDRDARTFTPNDQLKKQKLNVKNLESEQAQDIPTTIIPHQHQMLDYEGNSDGVNQSLNNDISLSLNSTEITNQEEDIGSVQKLEKQDSGSEKNKKKKRKKSKNKNKNKNPANIEDVLVDKSNDGDRNLEKSDDIVQTSQTQIFDLKCEDKTGITDNFVKPDYVVQISQQITDLKCYNTINATEISNIDNQFFDLQDDNKTNVESGINLDLKDNFEFEICDQQIFDQTKYISEQNHEKIQ